MAILYNHITVEGNIGAGKTTLVKHLHKLFGGQLVLEQFADNPFLPKFYENPTQYAFPVELFFMAERYKQLQQNESKQDLFNPRVFSDYLFAKSYLFAQNNLNGDELILYKKLFDIIYKQIPKPDILIFLYAEVNVLLNNIALRAREYEKNITSEYLQSLHNAYFTYFKTVHDMRIVIVDTSNVQQYDDDYYQLFYNILQKEYKMGLHYETMQ